MIMLFQRKDNMGNNKPKQIQYKPKKEKLALIEPPVVVTGEQVLDYFGEKIWEHRVFILVALLVISNALWLVSLG